MADTYRWDVLVGTWRAEVKQSHFLQGHLAGSGLSLLPFPKILLELLQVQDQVCIFSYKAKYDLASLSFQLLQDTQPIKVSIDKNSQGLCIILLGFRLTLDLPYLLSSLSDRLSCQCHSSVLLPRTVASQTVLKQLCQLCKSSPCNRIQVHSPSLLLPVRQGSTLHVLSSASVIEPWVTDTGASGSDLTMHIEAGTLPVLRCCRPCFWALKTFSAMSVTLILFQPQDKRNMRCNRVGDSTGGNDFFQFTELAQREQRETVRFTSWFFCSLHAVWCWAGYLPSLGLLSHLFKSIILASTSQGLWRLNELTCAKYLEQCKVYISVCGYYHYFIIGEGMS